MISLEQLMPKDHLVRKVAKAIDFEFIRDEVAHLYCHDNGRPAVDSVRLFKYDADKDCYICPMEQLLIYSTTTRESYHTYKSNPAYCRTCPLRLQCTQNQKAERLITRHIYQAAMDNTNAVRLSEQGGKKLYKRRAETVERSFTDAKQHHGHRYARYREFSKVQIQCFLAAMRKISRK